jgi:peptidoglycan/LPS O-acetylase OafA/YrhL
LKGVAVAAPNGRIAASSVRFMASTIIPGERLVAPPQAKRPAPIPALTGIRFFAALHVVLFHYATGALSAAPWPVRAIIASGPSAVGLFYVLSGAVLVYSCTNETGELSGTRRSFWRARFARIYPTYLLALLIDAPFFASALLKAHDGVAVVTWGVGLGLPALLLLHAWTPLTVFAWNTPGWSVSAEAFFYTLFPSLAARLRSLSAGQLVRRVSIFYCLALVPPLLVLAGELSGAPLLQLRVPSGSGGLDLHTWMVRFAGFSPIARLPEFLIGICLGHWLRLRRGTLSTARAAGLELIAITLLAGAWIALGSHHQSKLWLDSGLLAPLFVLMIAALTLGSGPVARVLSTRPLQTLGDASYAMYILQEPVLIWSLKLPLIGTLPTPIFVPAFVVILIASSVACQRFIAEPARRWLVGSGRRQPVVTLQPAQGT